MTKIMKSKRQMGQSLRTIAIEAAETNQDIHNALKYVDACMSGWHNSFNSANGTVRDYLAICAGPLEKHPPMKRMDYSALWYIFVNLIKGPDSQEVKNVFVPVLARALAFQTKEAARGGKKLEESDMVRLMDITNRKRLGGMFSGESLHAVNYMMRTTAKQFSRQVNEGGEKVQEISDEQCTIAKSNTMVLERLRKRGVIICIF